MVYLTIIMQPSKFKTAARSQAPDPICHITFSLVWDCLACYVWYNDCHGHNVTTVDWIQECATHCCFVGSTNSATDNIMANFYVSRTQTTWYDMNPSSLTTIFERVTSKMSCIASIMQCFSNYTTFMLLWGSATLHYNIEDGSIAVTIA